MSSINDATFGTNFVYRMLWNMKQSKCIKVDIVLNKNTLESETNYQSSKNVAKIHLLNEDLKKVD